MFLCALFPREGCLLSAGPAAHLVAAARRAQRRDVQGVPSVVQPCSALPGPDLTELLGQNPRLRAVVNQHCWVCPLHPFLLPNLLPSILWGGEWGCSLSPPRSLQQMHFMGQLLSVLGHKIPISKRNPPEN